MDEFKVAGDIEWAVGKLEVRIQFSVPTPKS